MTQKSQQPDRADRDQDQTVENSFPASDPPARTGITGPGTSDDKAAEQGPQHERADDERPTGTPTSDRHATETAYVQENEANPTARR